MNDPVAISHRNAVNAAVATVSNIISAIRKKSSKIFHEAYFVNILEKMTHPAFHRQYYLTEMRYDGG